MLRPTTVELAFLVQYASDFGWLDVTTLPTVNPMETSLYALFERLLQALRLDQRQLARTPKLFDVLGQWLTQPPPRTYRPLSCRSPLRSTRRRHGRRHQHHGGFRRHRLGVAGGRRRSHCSVASALDVIARYGMKGTTLAGLKLVKPRADARTPPRRLPRRASAASAAMATFQAQYTQQQWLNVIRPIEDALRQRRRDALVAYLLAPPAGFLLNGQSFSGFTTPIVVNGQTLPGPPSTDEMFGYFLIDPER